MKTLAKIQMGNKDGSDLLEFGVAETEGEKEEMFKLRHRIYVEKKKYIP